MRALVSLVSPDARAVGLHRVGGITIVRRTAILAHRSGFESVEVIADEDLVGLARELDGTGARVSAEASVVEEGTLVLAAEFVPAPGWLALVRESPPSDSACFTDGAAVAAVWLSPADAAERAQADLSPSTIARDLQPGVPLGVPRGDFVRTAEERRTFEKRLYGGLVKETEGFMSRHVERPISLTISRMLQDAPVTPNQMTFVSMVLGLAGAALFAVGGHGFDIAGAVLFLLHSILDGCDGELARLRLQESRWGGVLDFWADNVVHVAVFLGLGIAWARETRASWPLGLSALAVLGTVASATLVYRSTMRSRATTGPLYTSVAGEGGRPTAFVRVADALSRRDFIWGVLVLAVLGWTRVFLGLAAVGAPLYALGLAALGRREAGAGSGP